MRMLKAIEALYRFRGVLYFAIILIGICLRFFTGTTLILDPDSKGYFYPVASLFAEFPFELGNRSYTYALLLTPIILSVKNINAILIFQHLLSTITTILICIFLYRNQEKEKHIKVKHIKFLLGIVFLLITFWNGATILFEKNLRPEGVIYPFLILFLFLCNHILFNIKKKSIPLKVLIGFACLTAFITLMIPRLTIAIYSVFLIINILIFHSKVFSLQKWIKIVCLYVVVFLIIISPDKLYNHGSNDNKYFGHKQFYFSSFPEIQQVIDKGDCVNKGFDKVYFPKLYNESIEKTSHPEYWTLAGYNIDIPQYILFDKEPYKSAKKNCSINDNLFFKDWFWKMNLQYPHLVLKKISRQMIYLMFHPKILFIYLVNNNTIEQSPDQYYTEYSHYLINKLNFSSDPVQYPYPEILNKIFILIGIIMKGLLIVLFPFYTFQLFKKNIDWMSIIIGIILWGTLITTAWLHTLDIDRYIEFMIPITTLFFLYLIYLSIIFLKKEKFS